MFELESIDRFIDNDRMQAIQYADLCANLSVQIVQMVENTLNHFKICIWRYFIIASVIIISEFC